MIRDWYVHWICVPGFIGVAAAMGVALGVLHASGQQLDQEVETICGTLAGTRPTAVNLFWAIERMKRLYASVRGRPIGEIRRRLVPDHKTVLTYCNAGALATAGYGTALGVVRATIECGKQVDVFADETRPTSGGPDRGGSKASRAIRRADDSLFRNDARPTFNP